LSAARKIVAPTTRLEAKFNTDIGEVELFKILTVTNTVTDPETEVSIDEARTKLDPEAEIGDELLEKLDQRYGRIAPQAAKQNLIQRLRDAEREIIYNEFKDRKGEITHSGIVQRFEKKNIIVNLGRTDAILPEKEQIPRERYRQGDRLRALITDVTETTRGPQIILSRTSPELVRKLFQQEVPEVYEGIVEIKNVVREPGGRAKIAVVSNDSDVDPVGACVGMRGSRVQAVVQELRGERIDIVPWTPDETDFVCRALSPAKVSRIVIDEEAHTMEVIVPDDQLSLAIGRKGQNVRLAGRLSGWKLDVHSEQEYEKRQRESRRSLQRIEGLGDVFAELLLNDGYKSAAELSETEPAVIAEVLDCELETAARFIASAKGASQIERVERMVVRVAAGVSEAAFAMRPPEAPPEVPAEEADKPVVEGDAETPAQAAAVTPEPEVEA
jgi:N utilization substance protein A